MVVVSCSSAQSTVINNVKNEIQIGRTGYYFDRIRDAGNGINNEHPLRFPSTITWTKSSGLDLYVPYVSYRRSFAKFLSVKVSYEDYSADYSGGELEPPPYRILVRNIQQFQLSAIGRLQIENRFEFLPFVGMSYRFSPPVGEIWITHYVDHGFWREGFYDGVNFSEIGIGVGFELSYPVYKNFYVLLKGEYFNFPKPPRDHYGVGIYIGYRF